MFCSVIGCLESDTDYDTKLLPKDQSEMNVWSKFVKFRSLAICKDNKICEVKSLQIQFPLTNFIIFICFILFSLITSNTMFMYKKY